MATKELAIPNVSSTYHGKVRDVYTLEDGRLIMVTSNRISAFDVVLPREIPHKGQVLNQLAAHFLDETCDIVPNWKMATPDPQVTVGYACEPYKVEMVIRGFLTGHAWRTYKSGKRMLCGVEMPDGMKEHDRFPEPIITPATKAEEGDHDEDISREDIIARGIVPEKEYKQLEAITRALYKRGCEIANEQGLLLVDTKYEFGSRDGRIYLIDEVHTPDSSRYFYKEGYQERQDAGEQQMQLSKEFVREWLIENDFMGQPGQTMPTMTDAFVQSVSERYIQLYEKVSGKAFTPADTENVDERIETNINAYLKETV